MASSSEALVAPRAVGKISFTGGEIVGQHVIRTAAEHLKPVALEPGGQSANIIFADADLDSSAAMAAGSSLLALSVLPTRVYAQDAIFDEFVDRVRTHANALAAGKRRSSSAPTINGNT